MAVETRTIGVKTSGHGDMQDITGPVQNAIRETGLTAGVATLFVAGSTAGLTTIEFEPGAVSDFQRLFDEVARPGREYKHHLRWGDDNGHAHVRAALLGPSLSVPFAEGALKLGTWQQIILCDFDTRGRHREVVVQVMGE